MQIKFGSNKSNALRKNDLNQVRSFSDIKDFNDLYFKKNNYERCNYSQQRNLFTYNSLRFSLNNNDYLDKIRGKVSINYNLSLKFLSHPFEDLVINISKDKNRTVILFCPPNLSMFYMIKKFSKKLNKLLTDKNSRFILEISNVL